MADDIKHPRDWRAPVETGVQYRHSDLESFLEEHSANLSVSGMFIKTSSPLDPGTRFELRFSVGDDVTVIAATAQVVWIRRQDSGPRQPAGMGVRFLELDQMSRQIISHIVELHIHQCSTDEIDFQED